MAPANPVLVEVTRGTLVESRHRGAAVIVDSRDGRRAAWGDVDAFMYPRSSVKPLQALPLLETGAAARFGVSARELALASGSHSGEPDHVAVALAWLARLGLTQGNLICGPHPPIGREAAEALVRVGREPSPLHNNCSGKHLGFLTSAMHLGASLADYGHPEHPVQRRVRLVLSELGGTDLSSAPVAGDGCGVPVFAMPLVAVARAFALLAAPDDLPRERASAARRVVSAMTAHPYFVGGTDRFDALVTEGAAGKILVKGGAEGVCAAALLEHGLGFALKIDDGAKRAAETAMAALLARYAGGDAALASTIGALQVKPVVDTRSVPVGSIRPARGWPG